MNKELKKKIFISLLCITCTGLCVYNGYPLYTWVSNIFLAYETFFPQELTNIIHAGLMPLNALWLGFMYIKTWLIAYKNRKK